MEREEREMGREGRGKGEGREMRKERRGRRGGGEKMRGIVIGGMVLGLLMGCNNGEIEKLEKKSSFYESVVKIGQGFQEIFGIFGNAMGETLGIVKSTDKRSVVGEHFKKVKEGLEGTKKKLEELSGKISEAKNADIKGVEAVISSASEVIGNLIVSVKKLADAAGDSSIAIGAYNTGAVAAKKEDVQAVIEGVRDIINTAKKSDVKLEQLEKGDAGKPVTTTNGVKLLANDTDAKSDAEKLAAEVVKADPWAMINKIKTATTTSSVSATTAGAEAGALALGDNTNNTRGTAATNADLAAAVALKAMTKDGKFSSDSDNEAVKGAAAGAVNKVLEVLNEIIRRTVNIELGKIKDAVKEIKYSETTGTNVTETSPSTK